MNDLLNNESTYVCTIGGVKFSSRLRTDVISSQLVPTDESSLEQEKEKVTFTHACFQRLFRKRVVKRGIVLCPNTIGPLHFTPLQEDFFTILGKSISRKEFQEDFFDIVILAKECIDQELPAELSLLFDPDTCRNYVADLRNHERPNPVFEDVMDTVSAAIQEAGGLPDIMWEPGQSSESQPDLNFQPAPEAAANPQFLQQQTPTNSLPRPDSAFSANVNPAYTALMLPPVTVPGSPFRPIPSSSPGPSSPGGSKMGRPRSRAGNPRSVPIRPRPITPKSPDGPSEKQSRSQ